ncbi:transglutaminase domain-containing protein [Pseudomonas aeruginosa]|nr:transglutaminase [Pseudomonas paraeruginosa]VFT62567.1 transglutaminase domain-containing protein [Pseudomonas aeruginosa]VTM10046.1 transglutaminase domain-containing protein [Pseudomonas aeruginosa]
MQSYLQSGRFVDSDHPVVVEFAEKSRGNSANPRDQAVVPYDAVRYDPYVFSRDPPTLVASHALQQGCVPKAILLAACARHCRLPAPIGLADVRNHLATPRLLALLCSDVFAMHPYAELYLDGRWVKATPAFSRALCRAFDVAPLEFDGVADSVSMRSIARAKATGSTWPTTCSGTIRICSPAPRGRWAATCRPGPGKMKAIDSHHQPARLPSSVHHR